MIHVPLPSWKNLLRILLPTSHSNEKLTTFWSINGKVSGWLSQSAWSLVLISLWRKKYKTESSLIIWIPDYFCNTSLMILRFTGAKFIFYPITEDMSPDIAVCYKLAIDHPPDLFLLVHYFGRSNFSQEISDFCIKLGCWFIEDATHVFRPVKGIGSFGDFVLETFAVVLAKG